jgi:hypothetical protein
MKQIIILLGLLLLVTIQAQAQKPENTVRQGEYYGTTTIDGEIVKVLIIDGDTLPVIDLEGMQVTRKRNFSNRGERKRYHQWRKYAAKVYPYAAEAIRLYRELEAETKGLKKGKRRKQGRKREKELRPKYQEEIKKLTKTQGFILIKMVERELDLPFYDVIKEIEGGWKAMSWQALGKWYGYNLKTGYDPNKDPLLEVILDDLNINYGAEVSPNE